MADSEPKASEMEFFEENSIYRNDNIEAYSKLTENKTKIAEIKEINK